MPFIQRLRQRLGWGGQIAVLCCFLVILCGSLIIALLAYKSALNDARRQVHIESAQAAEAQRAEDISQCINHILKQYAPVTKKVNDAQLAWAKADQAYNRVSRSSFDRLYVNRNDSDALAAWHAASAKKIAASDRYEQALQDAADYRAANPLGYC